MDGGSIPPSSTPPEHGCLPGLLQVTRSMRAPLDRPTNALSRANAPEMDGGVKPSGRTLRTGSPRSGRAILGQLIARTDSGRIAASTTETGRSSSSSADIPSAPSPLAVLHLLVVRSRLDGQDDASPWRPPGCRGGIPPRLPCLLRGVARSRGARRLRDGQERRFEGAPWIGGRRVLGCAVLHAACPMRRYCSSWLTAEQLKNRKIDTKMPSTKLGTALPAPNRYLPMAIHGTAPGIPIADGRVSHVPRHTFPMS